MKKIIVVSVLVFIAVSSMLNEGLQADVVSNTKIQDGNNNLTPGQNQTVPPPNTGYNPISNLEVRKGCKSVTISWKVSSRTTHTHVVLWSKKMCIYGQTKSGTGYFSQIFYLPSDSYSFQIHAVVSGINYYSKTTSFWFVKWC